LGFRVSDYGYLVSRFSLRVLRFWFRVSALGFRVSCIGIGVWGLRFGVCGSGYRVQGFRASGLRRGLHAFQLPFRNFIENAGPFLPGVRPQTARAATGPPFSLALTRSLSCALSLSITHTRSLAHSLSASPRHPHGPESEKRRTIQRAPYLRLT